MNMTLTLVLAWSLLMGTGKPVGPWEPGNTNGRLRLGVDQPDGLTNRVAGQVK